MLLESSARDLPALMLHRWSRGLYILAAAYSSCRDTPSYPSNDTRAVHPSRVSFTSPHGTDNSHDSNKKNEDYEKKYNDKNMKVKEQENTKKNITTRFIVHFLTSQSHKLGIFGFFSYALNFSFVFTE